MHSQLRKEVTSGYTRVDLLFAIATVALLGTVGLSVPGSSAVRSDSAVCANNLRQIGRAFQMWATDHGGQNPWWVHWTDGGSFVTSTGAQPPGGLLNVPGLGPVPASLRNNTWFQFGFVSPELQTPAILLCPTDRSKVRAKTFSNNPADGFYALSFQNRAHSYLIGTHAVAQVPSSMLSGDRSLKESFINGSCSANVGSVFGISTSPFSYGWTSDLHPDGGNLLANDGRVEFLSAPGQAAFFAPAPDENGAIHFLKP